MERFFLQSPVEATDDHKLTGYVTRWNVLSGDRGGYRDVFRPGAFGDIERQDVLAFLDHNDQQYLGRLKNGSLSLATDAQGLRFSLELPDTTLGRDVAALVRRGDLSGMSFGYLPDKYAWKSEEQGTIREHTAGTLVEVSVVYQPAFPFTSVELNRLQEPSPEVLQSLRDFLGTPNRNKARRILELACVDKEA
jgi:uncharacterized protein